MNVDEIKAQLDARPNLMKTLGLELVSTPNEPNVCRATLAVTPQVSQPFGYLNGGTSLAIAENVAGAASASLEPGCMPMGTNVSAHHLIAVPVGETVTAVATILHQGRTLHVWNVDIVNAQGQVASTARVTNYIIRPEQQQQ